VTNEERNNQFSGVAILLRGEPSGDDALDVDVTARRVSVPKGSRRALVTAFILTALSQLVAVAVPIALGRIVQAVSVGATGSRATLVAALAATAITIGILNVGRSLTLLGLRQRVDLDFFGDLVGKLVDRRLAYFERRPAGDLLTRISSAAVIRDLFMNGLLQSAMDGLTLVVAVSALLIIQPAIGVTALAVASICLLPPIVSRHRYREANIALLQQRSRSQSKLLQLVKGIETAKMASIDRDLADDWTNAYSCELAAARSVGIWRILFDAVSSTAVVAAPALFAMAAAWGGDGSVSEVVAIAGIGALVATPAASLGRAIVDFNLLAGHLQRLEELAGGESEPSGAAAGPRARAGGSLELRNVSYRPAGSAIEVLHDVSLVIDAGESVAVVGPSGSGKSTLAKLMLGLYFPTSGSVLIDGFDTATSDVRSLRRGVAGVAQVPTLFPGAIADNVRSFRPSVDDALVTRAIARAGLAEDLASTGRGPESLVGEDGYPLSGGQRQRVALARALAGEPRILVVDEVTSMLDPAMEAAIAATLAATEATRVLVTHDRRLASMCDRIIELEAGRVVADRAGRADDATPTPGQTELAPSTTGAM